MRRRGAWQEGAMDLGVTLLTALAVLLLLLLTAKLLAMPQRIALRAALNALLGLGTLLLVEATGSSTGLTLGISLVNAIIVGILGVPGVGVLFLAQWIL